jgi:hypothetical protein
LAVTISMALFMGALDYLFSLGLGGIVGGSVIVIAIAGVVLAGSIAAFVVVNLRRAQ